MFVCNWGQTKKLDLGSWKWSTKHKKSQALDTPSYQKSVLGIPLRAANGKNPLQIRSENAHLAMLNSAFRASLE